MKTLLFKWKIIVNFLSKAGHNQNSFKIISSLKAERVQCDIIVFIIFYIE